MGGKRSVLVRKVNGVGLTQSRLESELVRKSQREARASLGVAGKARGRTRSGSVAALHDQILGAPQRSQAHPEAVAAVGGFPHKLSDFDCPRCGGLMSPEHFINRAEGGGDWAYPAWRCVYCGEVIDSLILLNRRRQKDHGETGIKRRGRPSQEAHRPFRS